MKTKFVIADPGLDRLGGHNFTLALSFSNAAHELGHDVLWLCHKEFPSDLVPSHIRAEKVFSLSYYETSKPRWIAVRLYDWLADALGHDRARRLARGDLARRVYPLMTELATALKDFRIGPADHVFVTTAEYLQYVALLGYLSSGDSGALPCFHVRMSFDEAYPLNRRFGLRLPQVFRRLRELDVIGRRVFLYAETRSLAAHLGSSNHVHFDVLGNPVPEEFLDVPARGDRADGAPADRPLTVVFPGLPRREKGYLRLPRIVAGLLGKKDLARPVRFVFQSYLRKSQSWGWARWRDRDRRKVRDTLKAYPDSVVHLVERSLSNNEYYSLIADADVLLLPYQADRYRTRPSMIVTEAALFGKPVVVTAATTLAELAEPGLSETASTDAEFADGLAKIVNGYDAYRANAEARATTLRRELDARVLVKRMLQRAGAEHAYACAG